MLPTARDHYEAWLRKPAASGSSDPRFEVRPARLSEYERIYDLVDTVFGVARPRALYDWAYRRNPLGAARCWVVVEKGRGRIVCSVTHFPWPIARDGEAVCGTLAGDSAVDPEYQRQGISALRRRVQDGNPIHESETRIGWPNEKSIGRMRKSGHAAEVTGPLYEGVFPLDASVGRISREWARRLVAAGGRLREGWARDGDAARRDLKLEAVGRFDSSFDEATQRCMAWKGFWSPHDAEFLNWRYLDRPVGDYRALAVRADDEVAGYCVIRTDGDEGKGLLLEFAAPEQGEVPRLVLRSALKAAREAGCRQLGFFATPGWRHWPTFRAAGMVPRRPHRFVQLTGSPALGAQTLENWQLVPGDGDSS
jgi:GNAT superfamily N-acetyltransferase